MRYLIAIMTIMIGVSLPVFAAISPADLEKAYVSSYKLEQAGQFDEAITALDPVYKDYGATYTVNLRIAYLNYLSKRYATAVENYNKAIAAAPSALDAKLGKMMALLAMGKYSDAEQEGYQVLKVDYGNYLGNLRLAFSLRMQQKNEIAEKVELRMLALYPIDASFLAEYGILKYNTGNLEQSKRVFQDMLILDPSNRLAKDYLRLIEKASTAPKAAAK